MRAIRRLKLPHPRHAFIFVGSRRVSEAFSVTTYMMSSAIVSVTMHSVTARMHNVF